MGRWSFQPVLQLSSVLPLSWWNPLCWPKALAFKILSSVDSQVSAARLFVYFMYPVYPFIKSNWNYVNKARQVWHQHRKEFSIVKETQISQVGCHIFLFLVCVEIGLKGLLLLPMKSREVCGMLTKHIYKFNTWSRHICNYFINLPSFTHNLTSSFGSHD